ncbi:Methyltransferase domain-containing protein [Rhizobium sp. RU33A]|uniref:class I SAM-dependent methyltransferase n=1 Tax=Rhizobium sp. RU33A TaxID=1907413 RepID=UPI0009570FFF|nr:class I SAM-dependent methyltransferase [Rhizobium sp. RU33A]SIR14672.1 Methyltransferase domain-containing protein [Rhizobium sp. RU33A]
MTKTLYNDVQSLLDAIDEIVVETDIALDVGCGIVPMNYFRPKLHIMVEPWEEYSNILRERHSDDKSVLILRLGALEALGAFHDKSIDSIFLLDVIEHLDKDVGFKVISELERVAARQVVIFTPLGFMPQHVEAGEPDAWGLSGGEMQEHKSGWLPEDFGDGWEFHICETYHSKNFRGDPLEKVYGAFFAVRNVEDTKFVGSLSLSDIRRPLPSEIALLKLQDSMVELKSRNAFLEEQQAKVGASITEIETARTQIEAEKAKVQAEKARVQAESMEVKEITGTWAFKIVRKLTSGLRR